MPREHFSHVDTWVFDLDNTLYPPHMRLFDQIEVKMTDFVMRTLGVSRSEADGLRSRYWAEYGTTLAGLMHHHDIDPEPYLAQVHDISFAPLAPDHDLAGRISALSGRKIVYTNGTAAYAENVLGRAACRACSTRSTVSKTRATGPSRMKPRSPKSSPRPG